MNVLKRVKEEMRSFQCEFEGRIATVGTTARDSQPFSVLPRRNALGFEAINFLVLHPEYAEECFTALDGKVKYILVDIEMKKQIDLMEIARKCVQQSTLVSYKPNDTTLEAADFFLRHSFADNMRGKKVFIYGAGNLGTKLALRLAERGAEVFLDSRNPVKTAEIIRALNYLMPRCSSQSIYPVQSYNTLDNEIDIFISFTSASHIITPAYLTCIKKGGLALDGGINNFTDDFIKGAARKSIDCCRLDVRAAFPHTILFLLKYIQNFYENVQGEAIFCGVKAVAGGVMGKEGDIVLDQIRNPKQIVGIANGIGGLKPENMYTDIEKQNLQKLRDWLEK
ncbi:hypothetical protein M3221_18500 [Domibacillus indicus]|uniref:hypothetical protein n=1 Tax=Domibacillus indicus TaxID=1437523 RepID=UPI00203B2B17|nr:hypothetical protein [Domibacillus indicus]MCM3790369.1 hypothetical protein [Domibacillus indicus]